MENIDINEYIPSRELQNSFDSRNTMRRIMINYKVDTHIINHTNYYNKQQVEKVLQDMEYRKSIAIQPEYKRKDKAYELPKEIRDKSYTALDIAAKYMISKVYAIRLLHISKAPHQVGNYRRHWYPKEWIDANFGKVLEDAKRRDKRRKK